LGLTEPLYLDYETFSEIDLKKCGVDVYARDTSTKVLLTGYAIGDNSPKVWDNESGAPMPDELRPYLVQNQGEIRAFNAPFEIAITEHTLLNKHNPTGPQQWRCAQVMAYGLSFAGGLDQVLKATNLGEKNQAGKNLIQRFSKPNKLKPKPGAWEEFKQYCNDDVSDLRKLWLWCEAYNPIEPHEWELWRLDRVINQRGLPVDLPLVERAVHCMDDQKASLKLDLIDIVGEGNATNIPYRKWLNERGCKMENLQRATKEAKVKELADGPVKHSLEIHLQIAQASSSSKWTALEKRSHGGVIRDTLQFGGAGRTRRWAGRGLQLQNLKRSPENMQDNIQDILTGRDVTMYKISTSIRGAILAPGYQQLVVSDLSSIESRLAGWFCKAPLINETFTQGKDTYKVLASAIYGVPYDQVTKEQRGFAKPAALGAQYQLGAKGLVAYAEGYGVTMDQRTAKRHIDTYRGLYPEVKRFWYWIKDAIARVVTTGEPFGHYGLTLYMEREFLFIQLPSGRRLNYFRPEMRMEPAPWDPEQKIQQFTYMGMAKGTYIWTRISAHGGGILENIIQAIARDILAVWMMRADRAGHHIIGHVHDELITLSDGWRAASDLQSLNDLAAQPMSWAPGLALTADGYCSVRYKKG
jgi:DNA polymerase